MYNQPPVFFDLEREQNGEFTANTRGEYYAEAFGYDPNDIPYKPQLLGGSESNLITVSNNLSEVPLVFEQPEFRVSRVSRNWKEVC